VAESVAQGNLDSRLEVRTGDELETLAGSIKRMVRRLETLIAAFNRTTQELREGRIEQRVEVTGVGGAYQEMADGFNGALESVIGPLMEAIRILRRYAAGDLGSSLREQPGALQVLPDAVEEIRGNLNALIEESLMLAMAAEEGRLEVRSDESRFRGSYCAVIRGLNSALDYVLQPIEEGVACLDRMAGGDLSREMQGEYHGDHERMKKSLNTSLRGLNRLLSQVKGATEQVHANAGQVADTSQALSQGSTEQAASLVEIAGRLKEIGKRTHRNADHAGEVDALSDEARSSAERGRSQMEQLLAAIGEISESSGEISRIIKVIDEIAFQTNLLALNAAVEAARAGVHGKGFAVVADEVRNLAQRSAGAARETTRLIEGSVARVERGTAIAGSTGEALREIMEQVSRVSDLVGEISSSSSEQAREIDHVNQALEQIDRVTQANAALTEESAAAAEDLSAQAAGLRAVVERFRLGGRPERPGERPDAATATGAERVLERCNTLIARGTELEARETGAAKHRREDAP